MPRIGVFVCHCGHNIASTVNVEEVVAFARGLLGVVYADHNIYSCSEEGLSSIRAAIKDNQLDRVVVAACTPRTHEPLFRRCCEQAGVNKYLFEFVNIREHCSWIHAAEPSAATEKAKRLVAMGVAKAGLLEPQEEGESDVIPRAVVIGAGLAGLAAASSLAAQGIETHIIERGAEVGGLLGGVGLIGPEGVPTGKVISTLLEETASSPKLSIHLNSCVKEVSGYVGNFGVTIEEDGSTKQIDAGAIIVATGANEFKPVGEYGYGGIDGVVTQLEFERMLSRGEVPKRVVFVQCVGSRQPGREYCSRICCNVSLKNAERVLESSEDSSASIIHRDIMSSGTVAERLYRSVSERGARFVRYDLARPPEIARSEGGLRVEVFDEALDEYVVLDADTVVLATPLVSQADAREMGKLLKVPTDRFGFFLEAHVKLRPVEFATDGIFVCGSARWPGSAQECISQGMAAAAKASVPIKRGSVVIEAITAEVDEEICAACGNCVLACPYEAVEMVLVDGRRRARVNEARCKGCGTCVASCHNDAMQQRGFTTRQLSAMIDALIGEALEGIR